MAAVADIKFTQGPNTDVAGRAVAGTLTDGVCNISNGDNTDVHSWEIELLYSPPGSAVVPGVLASATSNTPAAAFTPDVTGSYRVRERVWDVFGVMNEDIRNFGVPNFRGIIIPPYQNDPLPIDVSLKADEMNFSGQAFGWAGDRVVGLFEKYFETDRDIAAVVLPNATHPATPFTVLAQEADLYLVDTNTIGGASVVNLPAAARIGQPIEVRDNEDDAFTNPITVNLPGGDTFEDTTTSRVIFADGGAVRVVKVAATEWRVLKNTNKEEIIPLLSSEDNTQLTGFQRVSGEVFNPDRWPAGARFIFEAVLETSDVLDSAEVRLFNVTTAGTVLTLSTASLTPVVVSQTLTSPADLAAGANIYDVLIRLATTGAPNVATIGSAHLRAVYSRAS
jgi:hypothetical protein